MKVDMMLSSIYFKIIYSEYCGSADLFLQSKAALEEPYLLNHTEIGKSTAFFRFLIYLRTISLNLFYSRLYSCFLTTQFIFYPLALSVDFCYISFRPKSGLI